MILNYKKNKKQNILFQNENMNKCFGNINCFFHVLIV